MFTLKAEEHRKKGLAMKRQPRPERFTLGTGSGLWYGKHPADNTGSHQPNKACYVWTTQAGESEGAETTAPKGTTAGTVWQRSRHYDAFRCTLAVACVQVQSANPSVEEAGQQIAATHSAKACHQSRQFLAPRFRGSQVCV